MYIYIFFTSSDVNALKTIDEKLVLVHFVAIWNFYSKSPLWKHKNLHFKTTIVIIGPKCTNQMGT